MISFTVTEAPAPLLADILSVASDKRHESSLLITKAWHFAEKAHGIQRRLSGGSYMSHPATVSYLLAQMGLDTTAIVAGLLHDVLEDTSVSAEALQDEFGPEVLRLVDGVTKLGAFKYQEKNMRNLENLQRVFSATVEDPRVMAIKLCDRLHNMRTNIFHVPERRLRKALETLSLYVPIAKRMGLGRLQRELADLAFSYVDPENYANAQTVIQQQMQSIQDQIPALVQSFAQELHAANIPSPVIETEVQGVYDFHEDWERMGGDGIAMSNICIIVVIVPTVPDCYRVLECAHRLWHPLPGATHDYIAMPKANDYRSLHTTVLTKTCGPVQIRMRTLLMDTEAKFGIFAPVSAPSASVGNALSRYLDIFNLRTRGTPRGLELSHPEAASVDSRMGWFADMVSMHDRIQQPDEFMASLQNDFFKRRILVLTPQGSIINLPQGACAIDFAFAVDAEAAQHLSSVEINGKKRGIGTVLRGGDVVEVLTSPPSEPHVQSHEWWRELLWPCPQAWAGLVTLWLLILGLHLMAGTDSRPSGQPTVAAISPEWWAVLAEQRRLLAELLPPPEPPPIRRPKEPADRPRSEGSRQREFPMTQLLELPRSFV